MIFSFRNLLTIGFLSFLSTTAVLAQVVAPPTDSLVRDTVVLAPTVRDSLLIERLAKLEKDIALPYHESVQKYVDLFIFKRVEYVRQMLEKRPVFFPLYEKMLAQYDLPDELKYLSIVESALNPRAVSRSGAGGLWQFMPGTGRDMRLYQDEFIDERMDPVKSTEAACKYLRDLYNIFGDWHLALAAYNCGPNAVKRAMRRSGGDSFWNVYNYLPKETRSYVPLFITTTYFMHHAGDHGIFANEFEAIIPNDTIQISGYFNLETFARQSTMPLADLKKLNPALNTTILPEYTDRYPLRVPRQQYAYFSSRRHAILDSASRLPVVLAHVLLAKTETVQLPDNPLSRMTTTDTNPLAGLSLTGESDEPVQVAAVQKAKPIPVADNDEQQEEEADETVPDTPQRNIRKQTYVVRRGDNLMAIANRYDVTVTDIKRWNHLHSTHLQNGQELVIQRVVREEAPVAAAAKPAQQANTKRYKPRYHRVEQGDTLWNIVRRYDGLTIEQLKKMNHMQGNTLQPGQKLKVG